MKKLLLLAAFGVAGLVSAKNSEKEISTTKEINVENKDSKSKSDAKTTCYSYGIIIGCTNEVVNDTACGETYEEARRCMNDNAALMNEFFCG